MDEKDLVLLGGIGVAAIIETFTSFSPLIIGGIIASASFFTSILIADAIVNSGKEFTTQRPTIQEEICLMISSAIASVVVGVSIQHSCKFLFPGVMLEIAQSALVGTVIGVIAPLTSLFVVAICKDYIIESVKDLAKPVVEEIKKCFASKEA